MPEQVKHPIVILGAGHAGVATAAALRMQGWDGGLTLIDESGRLPYERPPLSKEALQAVDEGGEIRHRPLRKDTYFESKNIERVTGHVDTLNAWDKTVRLEDGRILPYYRLVIATGARGREFNVPGANLPGVQQLRNADDAELLNQALAPGAKVVIVGAGYIGMEVAAAATLRGCDVHVLEFQDRVMKRVTSPIVSEHFEKLHRSHGVNFTFGAAVSEIQGDGRAERVLTADGLIFDADVVVVGIGVVPNTEIAEAAGVECRDGIIVDAHGRTSEPSIYAAGDVTRFVGVNGEEMRLESMQNATQQAEIVAASILGKEPRAPEVPWFWTVQFDRRLQTAGLMHPTDEIILRGSPDTGQFTVCYLRDGALAAVDTIGSLADFRAAKKLIAAEAVMDRGRLADPSNKLDDCVAELTPTH